MSQTTDSDDRNLTPEQHVDLYSCLGREFGKKRLTIKNKLFVVLYGMAYAEGTPEAERPLLDRCRDTLLQMGYIPLAQAKKIRFVRTVELLVIGGPLQYGAMEEDEFEAGTEHEVTSITPEPAPSTDMAKVIFKDGRQASIMCEDFEVVAATDRVTA